MSGPHRSSPGSRSRTGSPASPRPVARPTASSTCSPSRTSTASRSTSTSSAPSPTGRRSSPTCSRAAGSPRPTCTRRAASPWSCASCSRSPASSTGRDDRRRPVDRRDRGGLGRDARPEGRRPAGDAAQAERRPGDPPWIAVARRLRRQARGPRAPPAPRTGARLRFGGGLLRRGPRPADQAR